MKTVRLFVAVMLLSAAGDGLAKTKTISVNRMLKNLAAKIDPSWKVEADGDTKVVCRKAFPLDIMVMGDYDPSKKNVFEARIEVVLEKKWSKERHESLRQNNEAVRKELVALEQKYPSSELMKNKLTAFNYWNEKRALMKKIEIAPAFERGEQSVILRDNLTNRVATTAERLKDEKEVLKEVQGLQKQLLNSLRGS